MKTPKIEDFKLQSFKKLKGGGLSINYHYMYVGQDGNAYESDISFKNPANMHDDLKNLLETQISRVLMVEGVDYRTLPKMLEKMGRVY